LLLTIWVSPQKTAAAELDGFLPSIGPFPDAVPPLFKDNDDLTQKDQILLVCSDAGADMAF